MSYEGIPPTHFSVFAFATMFINYKYAPQCSCSQYNKLAEYPSFLEIILNLSRMAKITVLNYTINKKVLLQIKKTTSLQTPNIGAIHCGNMNQRTLFWIVILHKRLH